MKKFVWLLILLYIPLCCIAQVGINTDNPKALLHLDGASTAATTNPQTGSVSALQASDDVTVTTQGNVGVGTIVPSTKLHIVTGSADGLKIKDTSEGLFKVLVSDSQGVGRWTSRIGAWFAVLRDVKDKSYNPNYTIRQIKPLLSSAISSSTYGAVNAAQGSITVPVNGIYRIIVGGHWGSNRLLMTPYSAIYIAGVIIRVNGIDAWAPNTICKAPIWGVSPTFVEILTLTASDVITIFTNETSDNYSNKIDEFIISVELLQAL